MAGPSRGSGSTGGGVRGATGTLFKVGNLAKFRTRSGREEVVVILNWEASEDWVEVRFSQPDIGGWQQWVAAGTLELISERR